MCQMLLSINPEHIENILLGKKQFEFRKVRCKAEVDKIIMYATAPEKMVVAEADIEEIIEADLKTVWEMTHELSGISYDFYEEYYRGKVKAVAYKLCRVTKYPQPKPLSAFGIRYAPQSFVYVE